jgi:hypothetical protein
LREGRTQEQRGRGEGNLIGRNSKHLTLNPFQNLVYGFDTLAAGDNPLRYVLLSPVSRLD